MTLARSFRPVLLVTLFACSKPVPTECSAWATTPEPSVERCGDDALVRRVASPTCSDGCLSDLDCDDGTLCVCGAQSVGEGSCEPTGCRTALDCEVGECIAHIANQCGSEEVPTFGFHCQLLEDDCALDADCAEGQFCRFVEAELLHRCFGQEAFSCD